jgi:hypothetical protein
MGSNQMEETVGGGVEGVGAAELELVVDSGSDSDSIGVAALCAPCAVATMAATIQTPAPVGTAATLVPGAVDAAQLASEEASLVDSVTAQHALSRIDESLAHMFASADESVLDRLLRLREVLSDLLTTLPRSEAHETLSLLRSILSNARSSRDAKYAIIKKSKAAFKRVVLDRGGAARVLLEVGFADAGDVVRLTRRDEALLYIGESLLDVATAALSSTVH